MKPRILFVTAHLPHAPSSGSELRSRHVIRALQGLGDVELCVVAGRGADDKEVEAARSEFEIAALMKGRSAPSAGLPQRLRDAGNPRRMNLFGLTAEESEKAWLSSALERFDLVWLHQLYVSYFFRRWRWPRSVMDVDDIPSTYERTVWQSAGDLRQRLRSGWKMHCWRKREALLGERFDALAVCSEADKRYLGTAAPIHVIPNGFERPRGEPFRDPTDPPRIGFIGLMDYAPNLEGVRWFAKECWPRIKRSAPDARLRLVGKGSDQLDLRGPDIDGLGWIDDPAAEMATWSTMIVPLQAGAGTRIKIAEAFSRKCPVVATSLGAYGYDAVNGSEMYLADSPEDFASACLRVIQKPAEANAMAERAWEQFLDKWTWDAIRPRVWATAEDCLRRSAGRPNGQKIITPV